VVLFVPVTVPLATPLTGSSTIFTFVFPPHQKLFKYLYTANMDELVELLWDSGTVVVHGQSSRPNTSAGYNCKFGPFNAGGLAPEETKEKEKKKMLINKDSCTLPEIFQFGSPEPLLDPGFFSLPSMPPSRHHDRDRVGDGGEDTDTDTVPWIDYPILDTSDRSSEGELRSNLNPNPQLLPPPDPPKPLSIQATVPVQKSEQDDASCSNKKPPHLHLQGGGLGVGLINFSHFLRPAVLAKATLQSAERLRSNEKASTSYNNSSTLQSMVIQSGSILQPPSKLSSLPKPQMPLPSSTQNEIDASNHCCGGNNKVPPPSSLPTQRIQFLDKEKEREKPKEKEKGVQPVLAPASVNSRNVDPKNKLKRKSLEEDNTTNSDEVCNNIKNEVVLFISFCTAC
jgi:hypothetical protein